MSNILNKEFYEKSRSFVKAALDFLITCLQKGEKIPCMMNEKFEIEKEGTYKTVYEQQPIFVTLLYDRKKELESLAEYQACLKVMTSDPVISKHLDVLVGVHGWRVRRTAEDYLQYLILGQLQSNVENIEFNQMIFDTTYGILERFFFEEDLSFKFVSPLHGFTAEDELIDLADNLRIRKITIGEQEQLLNEVKWTSLIPNYEVLSLKNVIELEYKTKKMVGEVPIDSLKAGDQSLKETIPKLVTALRLFKPGMVGYNIVRNVSTVGLPVSTGITSFGSFHKHFFGEPYTMMKLEAKEFMEFWKMISKIDANIFPQLSIALSRFNFAYERDKLEDKLIDFMVAFEALFFKEGETAELQHRLSVRASRFLEQEYEQRKLVVKKMKDFYEKRSKIVHGEKVELKSDFVKSVEDYLRKSIRLFLERLPTSKHDEIITHLDLD